MDSPAIDPRALRALLHAAMQRGGDVVLPRAVAEQVADELGRLQQSSDRLRRQNRRLRLRVQRARGGAPDPAAAADEELPS